MTTSTESPGSSPSPVSAPSTTTTTLLLPDIAGDQLPYDPAFSTSPAIPDEAFEAFLIIGSDARPGARDERADVIILALLPKADSAPILVSIPRDLWLTLPCWDEPNRINATLAGCGSAASGPELLAITVADFTGIEADHFALFDFSDFERVIDAFGGIEICVDRRVRDQISGLSLPAGCSKADGETALTWVRSRKTQEYRDGRWQRIQDVTALTRDDRQRDVLLQVLGKVKSLGTLGSLVDIVDSIADAVTIDDGITVGRAIGLAWGLRSTSPEGIVQITIPVSRHKTSEGANVFFPTQSFADVFSAYWPPVEGD